VDLATVPGTGPGGKITREDVLAAAAQAGSGVPAPEKGDAQAADERRPLSRLQQTIGRRMAESKAQAPHFYLTMRADMTEALALRGRLNAEVGEGGARISINDLIVKAVAGALRDFPIFNASFAGEYLTLHREIGMCIAVAIEEGLVTPVLRGADRKSLAEIAQESAALVERTRAGKNRPEDYEGGTFTLSNLGMYDVDTFVAIINPPQAAILAVGAVARIPVYQGETLVPRSLLSLTLSTDHRIADGATAARFLSTIRRALEQPGQLA
jgi:pyruvate dehydrogenase E2 component (dihydrolipoamide acetyltransferase)